MDQSLFIYLATAMIYATVSARYPLRKPGTIFQQNSSEPKIKIQESDISSHCKKFGICEDAPNYPENIALEIWNKIQYVKRKEYEYKRDMLEVNLSPRFNVIGDIETTCPTRKMVIKPNMGLDQNDRFHYILNPKDIDIQLYSVEICERNGDPCIYVSGEGDWVPFCKQNFTYRNMAVFVNDTDVTWVPIRVPSCCSCYVKSSQGNYLNWGPVNE